MKIAIIGAGIGGLAAAIGFQRFGHSVQIYEKVPAFATVGAGIQLSPNACQVLDAFDLMPSIAEKAFEPEFATIRDLESGRAKLKTPLRSVCQQRYGQPYLHIHRADLHAALLNEARALEVELQLGCNVGKINLKEKSVESNQCGKVSFDLLVGADGIHSTVREQLFECDEARFTGQVAWRSVVKINHLPEGLIEPDATVWRGNGRHLVTYFVRGGQEINLVAVEERSEWPGESWVQKGEKSKLLELFKDCNPSVTRLLEAIEEPYVWALHDRLPPKLWHRQNAVLLGDACHPMLPFMAQGAGMALEDAFVLSQEIGDGRNLSAALTSYQRRRQGRVCSVHKKSATNAALFHKTRSFGGVVGAFKLGVGGVFPKLAFVELDRLYGHKVAS